MRVARLKASMSLRHAYMFLLYCPPTSNIAAVSCPSEQYFVASISTANPARVPVCLVPRLRSLRRDFALLSILLITYSFCIDLQLRT